MKILALISLSLVLLINTYGQETGFYLHGNVSDSATDAVIENVSVKIVETGAAVISDGKGNFSIWISNIPSTVCITHLNYFSKNIRIDAKENTDQKILLLGKIATLPQLSVTTNKPINITKEQPLYIKDYEFCNDKIIVLAYKDKMLSRACVSLLNLNGDTICSVRIKDSRNLYRDCFGESHLLTKTTAWQIFIDSTFVDFIYPIDAEKFEETFSPVVAELNNKFFYQKYYYNNQILQYYFYDKSAKKSEELKVIGNEENLYMMRDRARIVMDSDDPAIQEQFEDLVFYKPVFAPLVKVHDTICIFNYADSLIEFYSDSCRLIKEVAISFHNDPNWKREIFVDDITGKVFALFRKNGISALKEINLKTGELKNSIVIPDFPFVEKIKIHNDNIYFLYTERTDPKELKKLYRLKI